MHYKFRWNIIIKRIPQTGDSLLSFFVEFCRSRASTLFDNLQRRLTKLLCKICRTVLSKNSTAVFDNIFRHNSTTFDKKFCRMLAKNVECRHFMAKNLVEKCCRASTIFFYNNFRQSSTEIYKKFVDCRRNLSNAVEIYCRKILTKFDVEKRWRKMLSNYNSTIFFDTFLQ